MKFKLTVPLSIAISASYSHPFQTTNNSCGLSFEKGQPPIHHHDIAVALSDQRIRERHPGRTRTNDQIIGIDLGHDPAPPLGLHDPSLVSLLRLVLLTISAVSAPTLRSPTAGIGTELLVYREKIEESTASRDLCVLRCR